MGSSILFFCNQSDTQALNRFAESLGMELVPPTLDDVSTKRREHGSLCFLSTVPVGELHPYGDPPVYVGDATDPLLRYVKSYYKAPYLVAGHIYWANDNRDLAKVTRPYYQKIRRWIMKSWLSVEGQYFIGPGAQELLKKGAHLVNAPPDSVEVDIVDISPRPEKL